MGFTMEAACGCHRGRVRRKNEDNLFFDGKYLEAENQGLPNPICIEERVRNGMIHCVFDGMGGENFGEEAAFAAARGLQQMNRRYTEFLIPERKLLNGVVMQLNASVVEAAKEQCTDNMGTTLAMLYYTSLYVYSCNVGDSRTYRLRGDVFQQLSRDHTVSFPGMGNQKAPLSQYLGIDPEEMLLEPYIAKGRMKKGDIYLICSDGLTDMLNNFEIAEILRSAMDMETCVRNLIDTALEKGGRDNITVIVSRVC